MSTNYSTIQQHQPLRVPQGWGQQEKAFVVQLDEIFDDIYRRYGRLRMEDMSEAFRKRISDDEGNIAELVVDVGQISIDVSNKYDKVSGIAITADGVDITGSKYVKIRSGATFDVESTNFAINSINKSMTCGRWTFNDAGMTYIDANNYRFEIADTYNAANDPKGGLYFLKDTNGGIVRLYIEKLNGTAYGQLNFETSASQLTHLYAQGTRYAVLGKKTYPFADSYLQYIVGRPYMNAQNVEIGSNLWIVLNGFNSETDDSSNIANGQWIQFDADWSDTTNKSVKIWASGPIILPQKLIVRNAIDEVTTLTATTVKYTNLYQNSSREIKHNIRTLDSVGDKLDALRPVSFVYDSDPDEKERIGLIYEEAQEVLPEICTDDESNKAVSYMELVPALLKEIQDLRARVAALEGGQ